MRILWLLCCLAILGLSATGRAEAQGPSSGMQFESLSARDLECTLPECRRLVAERRRSRVGHSVLVGALIGASAGLLTAAIAGGLCGLDDSADARPCAETVAVTFGITAGTGALIGLIVGASEPSHGPVPTD